MDKKMTVNSWQTAREYKKDYTEEAARNVPSFLRHVRFPTAISRFDMILDITIGKASITDPITIAANLLHSTVSSGALIINKDDQRGFFQDRIDVVMLIEKHPELHRVSDGPDTYLGTGSATSSVSVNFGGGGNIGFFGGTPTGGGNVSVGTTSTHSFSRQLKDFQVVNTSDFHTIRHSYQMSQSSGGPYKHPLDLVPSGDDISFVGAFKGIKLYEPPELATSNLPLISQAVWQASHNNPIDETLILTVGIKQHLTNVTGTNEVLQVHRHAENVTVRYVHHEKIPLHQLTGNVGTKL